MLPRHSQLINGDEDDLRFLDPKTTLGSLIFLRPKGKASKDKSGFNINPCSTACGCTIGPVLGEYTRNPGARDIPIDDLARYG